MIRQARDDKGLSNKDLADALGWRITRVIDMLSAGRPLRRVNAVKLLRATRGFQIQGLKADLRAKAQEANRKIDSILPVLEKPVLSAPALIAAAHIPVIAARLAEIMCESWPGRDKKWRAILASKLELALKKAAPEMAYMFCQMFTDSPNRKAIQWMISGYQKQFETMNAILEEK
jgi:hypothetical protein